MAPLEDHEANRWLWEFLAAIEARPGMFIGAEDVWTLDTFTSGYGEGLRVCGREVSYAVWPAFSAWLAATPEGKTWPLSPNHPWHLSVARLDPRPCNIVTFYRLFRQFLSETGLPPLPPGPPRPLAEVEGAMRFPRRH